MDRYGPGLGPVSGAPTSLPDGLVRGDDGRARCWWAGSDPGYVRYHDEEWGRPVVDDHRLFEKICLEGFQSGLSWLTILRKRENFRRAFAGFDYRKVAAFDGGDVARLLDDAGIVRHRGKIESAIHNAGLAVRLEEEAGSLWSFFSEWTPEPGSRPDPVTRTALLAMPTTPESTALSKELKGRGWTWVGPTTMYAFMQACGLVNDHLEGCWVRDGVEAERRRAL